MRTIIFIGLLTIADSINPIHMKETMFNNAGFFSVIILGSLFMDIIDFIKDKK